MLSLMRFGYKVTKPRVKTINTESFQAYRKQLHEARIRSRRDAVIYLNRIEDEFLEKHQSDTVEEHFNNQCRFRSKIARNAYLLFQEMQKNQGKHQQKLQMIQKHIRGQEMKRLNRDRIRKILEYESEHFWIHGKNVTQNFISEKVLPEYIGSTEYYHKLHSEAFAYDELDFDMLHKLSSNEQSVQHKNRLLIPLFKQILYLMKRVKFSDEDRANKQHIVNQITARKRYVDNPNKLAEELNKLKIQHENNIIQIKNKIINSETKVVYMKEKLREMIVLLKRWKQYTDILGMTSNQVLLIIEESKKESSITSRRKAIENDIEKKRDKHFTSAVEEDTQDQQITLQSFLSGSSDSNNPLMPEQTQSKSFNEELASLLEKQKNIFDEIQKEFKLLEQSNKTETMQAPNSKQELSVAVDSEQNLVIDESYLKSSETTASIEILKSEFSQDQSVQKLLNIAGELTVNYPKLFNKVWDNQLL